MTLDPATLPTDAAQLISLLLAAHARADALEQRATAAEARSADLDAQIATLKLTIAKMKRAEHGLSSEKSARLLDQLELQLGELVATSSEGKTADAIERSRSVAADAPVQKPMRRPLDDKLPRERLVHPAPCACRHCGSAKIRKLDEKITETLEFVPERWKVVQHVREVFTCRACERITETPAPSHPIARGRGGPQLLAAVLHNKYRAHLPLNRQSALYAAQGIDLDVSTLADWVGACAATLARIVGEIEKHVLSAERIHADDTTVPVLAKGKCGVARLWSYVRDDRPFGGGAAPAVVLHYARNRGAEHPERHLATYDDLPDDVAALKAMLLAARAENAALASENLRFKAQNERFAHILRTLRRAHFGRSSEKISEDQLNLALDDVQAGFAAEDAKAEQANPIIKRHATEKRRANRGHLPAHLPREEIVIEPDTTSCGCCGGALHLIGEDTSERLDKIPAKLRVLVTRRPKYACRRCEKTGADVVANVVQAPAPARLIAGGIPTEALVADVLVSKYADHLPLYRQAQILAREGVNIDRSTLCHWVGFAAVELEPLHSRLIETLKASPKLFCDETRCPVLDPGRGKTKTGYLWAIARDDRPWGSADPPAVAYTYAPGRGGAHARALLAGFSGTLQVDGYAGYNGLADTARPGGPVTLAFCWSHFRRQFYDIAKGGNAPIASEALEHISALYGIEAEIRGRSADERRERRQTRSKPLVEALKAWLGERHTKLPRSSSLAEAIRYGLNHWDGLSRFLDDGRIEIDSNTVERSIRPIALNRKNALFAGSDEGGTNWAVIASLIETCKLNSVNPQAWLTGTLIKLVNRWPAARIDDLMPWANAKAIA